MKKSLQVFVFVLALSTAYTLAQAGAGMPGSSPNQGAPNGSMGSDPGMNPQSGMGLGSEQDQSAMGATNTQPNTATTPTVDDQTLHREVHEQLASNPNLQNVQVEVEKGTVKLTGMVNNKDDRKQAKKLAQSVPGVKRVKDNITIASGNTGANSASAGGAAAAGSTSTSSTSSTGSRDQNTAGSIAGNAGSTTSTQPGTASSSTSSTPANGIGTSPNSNSSTSPNASLNQSSSSATPDSSAAASPGSQSSTTGVTSSTPGGQSATGSSASSSSQVQSDIQTALRNEPTLSSSILSVSVTDDSIELTGSAPSAKDREQAKRIAQSFAGNRRVVDNIKVAGTGSFDQSSGNVGSSNGPNSSTGASGTSGTPSSNSPNPEQPSVPKQ
jgi:osmotically-inducible protein OsmY